MMIICPKNFTPDDVIKIDLSKNIVICTPEKKSIITRDPDLKFSMSFSFDLNIASRVFESTHRCSFEHETYIKISHPIGLQLNMEPAQYYFNDVYIYKDEYYGYESKDSKDALYKLIDFHRIKVIFDEMEMRKMHPTFLFKKEQSFMKFWFRFMYLEPDKQRELGEIYLIQHDQLYEDFEKLVLNGE